MYWIREGASVDEKTKKVPLEDKFGNKASYLDNEYNAKVIVPSHVCLQ